MLLSIIIPVYNVEFYLAKCLDSIINQVHFEQIELILVNDGSTDDSLKICKTYASEYSNIIVLSQQNQGQGSARNKGIKIAKGKYIWFVDSDDWINSNIFPTIFEKLKNNNVYCIKFKNSNSDHIRNNYSGEMNYDNVSFLKSIAFHSGPVIYFIKRDFLLENQIFFLEKVFHEDEDFIFRLIYSCDSVKTIDLVAYIVNQRENSSTRSINPKRAFDLLIVMGSLYSFLQKVVKDEHKIIFYNRIALLFNNALNNTFDMDKKTINLFQDEVLKYPFIFTCLKRSHVKKYKLEGYLMELFPKKAILIYKILKFNCK